MLLLLLIVVRLLRGVKANKDVTATAAKPRV